jgi:flavodoxin
MKALVVYDSRFGNTEKIAMAIGKALSGEVKVVRAKEVNLDEIHSTDLLIAGSPTWGGRPSTEMREFLNRIPKNALNNIQVASFDTRDTSVLTKVFGKAAPRIAACLKDKGGNLVAPPEGFAVKGLQGPLEEGALERATQFAERIAAGEQKDKT